MTDADVIADVPSSELLVGEAFAGIFEAYQREGFEKGYARARHDLLAMVVFHAEAVLRSQNGPAHDALRKSLYAFIERIERELGPDSEARFYVENGLGI